MRGESLGVYLQRPVFPSLYRREKMNDTTPTPSDEYRYLAKLGGVADRGRCQYEFTVTSRSAFHKSLRLMIATRMARSRRETADKIDPSSASDLRAAGEGERLNRHKRSHTHYACFRKGNGPLDEDTGTFHELPCLITSSIDGLIDGSLQ